MNKILLKEIGDQCKVLDFHTIKSTYLGEDQHGNKRFDTIYTQLGGLVYDLKYGNNKETVNKILELVKDELNEYKDIIDIIVPVPPSNKNRYYQPVFELVKVFSKYLNKEYNQNILRKISNTQAKDGKSVENMIKLEYNFDRKVNILLVDDLLYTGNTLKECCKVLKQNSNVEKIYCLVMTKRRRK